MVHTPPYMISVKQKSKNYALKNKKAENHFDFLPNLIKKLNVQLKQ